MTHIAFNENIIPKKFLKPKMKEIRKAHLLLAFSPLIIRPPITSQQTIWKKNRIKNYNRVHLIKCSSTSAQTFLKELITKVGPVSGHQTNVAKQFKSTFVQIDIDCLLQLNWNTDSINIEWHWKFPDMSAKYICL